MGAVRHFANNVTATTLNGLVSSSTTAWTVDDGSTYPDVPFTAKCESEIVQVTAVSGSNSTSWTVERGFDGTTGASHADTTEVTDAVIAADISNVHGLDELANSSNRIGSPAVIDEFDDETFTGWTTVEDTSPNLVIAEKYNKLSIGHPGGDSSARMHGVVKAFSPAGNFYLETGIRHFFGAQNYWVAGLVASTNATYGAGNQRWAGNTLSGAPDWNIRDMSSWNTAGSLNSNNGSITSLDPNTMNGQVWYERLVYTSSSGVWDSYISPNGIRWIKVATRTSSLTTSYVGYAVSTWGGAQDAIATLEYFAAYNGAP